MLESPFNKVAGLKVFKKRLQHRCFALKFAEFLRTRILGNICERLLLFLQSTKHPKNKVKAT